MQELCASNGLPCDGICRSAKYKRATRTVGPICPAVYQPEKKKVKRKEQRKSESV